jgi:hypothetical protein
MTDRICSIDNCDNRHYAHGWCSKHVQMAKAHNGDPLWKNPGLGTCTIPDCDSPVKSLGLCSAHYQKQRKYGDPLGRKPTAIERYESNIDRTSTPDGCHPWTGPVSPAGYGKLNIDGDDWRAHRYGWTLVNGPIPEGLVVRHFVCDNPPCQNIQHLRVGTNKDNTDDMLRRFGPDFLKGSQNFNSKLTEADVACIRASYIRGTVTQSDLAAEFGVSQAYIAKIVNRNNWSHVA